MLRRGAFKSLAKVMEKMEDVLDNFLHTLVLS